MSTQPFYIDIDQVVLDDLKYRIQHARWPDAPGLSYLRELAAYWTDDLRGI